ncbi:spermidine synthase-like protein [Azoarcus communis]|uniref:spermine/spermidine synthase domain-containing protein n=1 Tax=Parazoarcus communis TaxID=41977 RepID=UPI0014599C45|nr:spermidine synthase-like protein [Parazoarcus communis]NMG48491.1 spermidine synthase-like protein [Parazoarcus communis]
MRSSARPRAAGTPIYELPSPFAGEPGKVLLIEPAWRDADELAEGLRCGDYSKPFVLEHDGLRSLYFGSLRFQQSAMRIDHPYALDVAYTQGMMAFMLFNPRPRSLCLYGLGGGSLAKFCYRHLPGCDITAVELDENVIAFRELFDLPADDARFRIECCDAIEHAAAASLRPDVVLVDLFDANGVAGALLESDFYRDLYRGLSGSGIMVMNLAGDKADYARHVAHIAEVFDEHMIAMSVREDGNYLLFAFRNPAFAPRWKWMSTQARELADRMGLDFPQFAQLLERGQTLRLAQRMHA